jgi:hypothetical protein
MVKVLQYTPEVLPFQRRYRCQDTFCISIYSSYEPASSSSTSSTETALPLPLSKVLCSPDSPSSAPADAVFDNDLRPSLVPGLNGGISCQADSSDSLLIEPENSCDSPFDCAEGSEDACVDGDVPPFVIVVLGMVGFWNDAFPALDWSAVDEGGVCLAFVSIKSAEELGELLSGFIVGVGVSVLLEVPPVGLVTVGFVVAVGPAGPLAGTVPVCVTLGILGPGGSNLCKGKRDHPSGITTPGGKSALPAGMTDVLGRAPCLCI